jgi:hypothetical protein
MFYSFDHKFVIKVVSTAQRKMLLSTFLQTWHIHVSENSRNQSLVCRVLGVYTFKLSGRASFEIILMQNLVPPELNVHAIYNLTGTNKDQSIETSVKAVQELPKGKVLKDGDFMQTQRSLNMKYEDLLWLKRIVRGDVDMLKSLHFVKYSLFVAVGKLTKPKHALPPRYARHIYLGTGSQSALCFVVGIIDYLQVRGITLSSPLSTPQSGSRLSQQYGDQFMKLLEDIVKDEAIPR